MGAAGEELEGLLGDGGLPDKDKIKAKAQGAVGAGFRKVGSLFTDPGGLYFELGHELLTDTALDGMEMGNAE